MRSTVLACVLLSLVFVNAAAAEDITAALKAAGATRFLDLVKAAGAVEALDKHSLASGTVILAPTNAAVDAWLKGDGLTITDMDSRKAMAQRVVGFLVSFPSGDISKAAAPMTVPTANMMWNMTIMNAGGKLTAMDSHDTKATVTPTKSPHVYLIDKMLLPGNVFPSLGNMGFKTAGSMKLPFTLYEAALARAGAMTSMKATPHTQFAPTDAAFIAAGLTKEAIAKADPATLTEILHYHTVAGYKTIPKGFKSGEPVATLLKGKTITVGTEEKAMAPGSKMMVGQATVTDAAGNVAHVVAPNYFTGKSTIHGIDKVLSFTPKSAAAAAAEPTDAKPAAVAAPGGRKLLQGRSKDADTASQLASSSSRDAILASLNSEAPDATFRATQIAASNAAFVSYPSSREFLYNNALPGGRTY